MLAELYGQMSVYDNARVEYEDLSERDLKDFQDQQAWVGKRKEIVARLRTGTGKLDLTNIVTKQAIEHTFSDKDMREHGRRLWREMSGDAHVLGWAQFQRAMVGAVDPRTGMGEVTTGGDWSEIAQPFVACHRLLREGWSLFDRRSEAPPGV